MDASPSSLQLMRALAEVGPEGLSREQLMERAAVSYASFYRALRPLLEARLVTVEAGSRYLMPLDNLVNFRLKLWHDAERLSRLAPADSSQVLSTIQQARSELGDNLRCLWLVGSAVQAALTEKSDLDFLAIVRKDRLYHPSGVRPVNFVMMTESVFGHKYREGDDFVRLAIRHGIVLLDLGYAQDFYSQLGQAGGPGPAVAEREERLEAQREKFHFFLREGQMEDARKALQSVAIITARLLLRQFGESPTTKTDVLDRCGLFFGMDLRGMLEGVVEGEPLRKPQMVQLNRRLAYYHEAATLHLSHLKSFSVLPAAHEMGLRAAAGTVLRELLSEADAVEPTKADLGADLVLRRRGLEYRFVFKSLVRGLTAFQVGQVANALGRPGRKVRRVLVVNAYRDTPVAERPPLRAALVRAEELGIRILTGIELLRLHNRLHLEGQVPDL